MSEPNPIRFEEAGVPAAPAPSLSDEALLADFEAGRQPPGGFHHRQHVQVAWLYLRREPWPEALLRFQRSLRRFAEAQGQPGLYHETVTVAFVLVIQERMAEEPTTSFDDFARRHADLLTWKPSVLERYYEKATLDSERSRRSFLMPDKLRG